MRVISAVIAVAEGQVVNVAEVCREAAVSRQTFYKWLARYRAEGLDGVEERSRRPRHSPQQTALGVEEEVVRRRKELHDAGLDHGATTIQWHMGRDRVKDAVPVPSVATIHRILVRRGLVVPEPHKRPKSSWQRFEAPAPNEWWQIDAMDWVTTGGQVKVFNLLDDHSRVVTRSRAALEATSVEAWTSFTQAAETWGLPAGVLSDNGLCFSGKLRGFEVLFEANLRDAGVRPFTGRPYHPQTTGKVERFQQTLKKWLRRQPLAADLAGLQTQLDRFGRIYNYDRPHQGIGRVTPINRWTASTAAQPLATPLTHPDFGLRRHPIKVDSDGSARVGKFRIHLGVQWARRHAIVLINERTATVFIDRNLVRHLQLDHSRTYQPSGRPRGPRPQLTS